MAATDSQRSRRDFESSPEEDKRARVLPTTVVADLTAHTGMTGGKCAGVRACLEPPPRGDSERGMGRGVVACHKRRHKCWSPTAHTQTRLLVHMPNAASTSSPTRSAPAQGDLPAPLRHERSRAWHAARMRARPTVKNVQKPRTQACSHTAPHGGKCTCGAQARLRGLGHHPPDPGCTCLVTGCQTTTVGCSARRSWRPAAEEAR